MKEQNTSYERIESGGKRFRIKTGPLNAEGFKPDSVKLPTEPKAKGKGRTQTTHVKDAVKAWEQSPPSDEYKDILRADNKQKPDKK